MLPGGNPAAFAGLTYNIQQMEDAQPITGLLRRFADGDKDALDRLIPLVYSELQRLADHYIRNERPGHTLQPTALVHEAYERLLKQEQPDYRSRAHFLGTAAQVMRQILIDHARKRDAGKRGGGGARFQLHIDHDIAVERPTMLIAIDDALQTLAGRDPVKARLIEMRYFGGLIAEESAEAMGMPVAEVRRQLRLGQAWLRRELDGEPAKPEKTS
jgi:RNA polymerase sigma-70 factor (ECF subfamily)